MKLRHLLSIIILALLVGLAINAARAEEVIETWRNPFGAMRSVSVNSTDGSVWVASGGSVLHLAADGAILSQIGGFSSAGTVSVNQTDGSCWVADTSTYEVIHLAADGTELLRLGGFSGGLSLSVNATDGSCWVGETYKAAGIVHLAEDGTELWRGTLGGGDYEFVSVSVNPADESCWAAGTWSESSSLRSAIVHLAEDGTELWRTTGATGSPSVNPTDGSCWVVNGLTYEVIHFAADGTELWRGTMPEEPESVAVNPTDGSCWVVGGTEAVRLAQNGTELWRGGGFDFEWFGQVSVNSTDGSCWLVHLRGESGGYGLALLHLSESGVEISRREADFGTTGRNAVNPMDGSCWMATGGMDQIVHLAEDGTELLRASGYRGGLSANPTDGSCWVAGSVAGARALVRLAEDGTELLRIGGFTGELRPSVNPTDGSCWVADVLGAEVVHFAQNGTVLSRSTGFESPADVSANPVDGSCWVADSNIYGEVVHLAEDGTELWRGGPAYGGGVSVNPTDGSCWVSGSFLDGEVWTSHVVHLAEDGTELWRGEIGTNSLSVDPMDGSCWVGGYNGEVIHLAEDGTELWRGEDFALDTKVSVNPMDGSCWVSDTGNGQVVRLEVVGYEGPRFPDIMPYHWAFEEVEACVEAAIVGGYPDGLYHPEREVSRGQMSVFVARGLAGGDEGVPDFTGTPTFPDVDAEHWALDYVEYVVSQNVVGGYEDGTYHPEYQVTRGQMSVYVARSMVAPTTSVLADYVPADPRNFPDVLADHWAYTYVEYCVEQGVVGGFLDGTYRPDTVVTRDQMAVYITRSFQLPT